MSEPTAPQTDHTLALREEFRHHLETFYAQLKLAPPYESVEKAIRSLTTSVHALPPLERATSGHRRDRAMAALSSGF